jgi:hypothetical protein
MIAGTLRCRDASERISWTGLLDAVLALEQSASPLLDGRRFRQAISLPHFCALSRYGVIWEDRFYL